MVTEPSDPVRLQRDEIPPVLYMDQMDATGRSNLLDLYNALFRTVEAAGTEDVLGLEDFAKWRILSMAYRTGSVVVSTFRTAVAVTRQRVDTPAAARAGEEARGVRVATPEQVKAACDEACRLLRNPAPVLNGDTLGVMSREAICERERREGDSTT